MRDRDVARVRLRPADPEPLAVLAEQRPDVGRPIEKNHRGYAYSAVRPLGSSVVKRLTVRQPSECSSPRRNSRGNRSTISRCQPVSSILRACLRPGPCCGKASGHLLLEPTTRTQRWTACGLRPLVAQQRQHHRRRAILDDVRIRGIADDDELEGRPRRRHAAVAQIHPQQVAVRPGIWRVPRHRTDVRTSRGRSGGSRTRTWDLRFWRPALPPAELIPQAAQPV